MKFPTALYGPLHCVRHWPSVSVRRETAALSLPNAMPPEER